MIGVDSCEAKQTFNDQEVKSVQQNLSYSLDVLWGCSLNET